MTLTRTLSIALVVLAAGCGLVTGCGRDVASYLPPAELVSRVAPLELSPATDETTTRPADAGFRVVPLTLAEARAVALENNPDLRVARIAPETAAAELAAEQALYDTVFSLDAAFTKIDAPTALTINANQSDDLRITPAVTQVLPTGGSIRAEFFANRLETSNPFATLNPSYETDARFTLVQPLGAGFGTDATEQRLRVAAAGYGISLARQKLAVLDTLAQVERSYWRLYAARRAVVVRREQVELATRQFERAQRRFGAGAAAEIEVVRARSGLADAREFLIEADAAAETAQRRLKQLVNASPDSPLALGGNGAIVPTTEPDPIRYALDGDRLAGLAEGQRMEMLEARLRIVEQNANVLAANNAYNPRVDLRYTYAVNGLAGDFGDSIDVLDDVDFEDHIVGVNVEFPIGLRATRERYRAALTRRLERLATLESRRLLIRREVLDAAADLDSSFARIAANRERVTAAARLLEAEVRQFERGTRTSTEVLEAQTNLSAARLSLTQALADYETARTDLAAATGTTLGKNGVSIRLPGPLGTRR
jgi:outer membrane protein TolC